ncbi:hypothetical protein IV203_027867 [Nitzschia inconspicua]|uniref:Uncharacterized protein n=1 Tax=Nitzschia inconspicua TaxID=303405 RepID=A0A9K3Q485_9STRA|nr:hypothetical protein IV203_027867 [Nitzschia inconspicua]
MKHTSASMDFLGKKSKLMGATRVFESSPEYVTKNGDWFHTDMVIGAGVEEIGDDSVHPRAPQSDGFHRDNGWARSAFHLHNFFADFNTTRYKCLTYVHPDRQALTKPLEELYADFRLLSNRSDGPINSGAGYEERQDFQRVEGGLEIRHPVFPMYFHDEDYRRRKHDAVLWLVNEDEYSRMKRLNLTAEELEMDAFTHSVFERPRDLFGPIKHEFKRFDIRLRKKLKCCNTKLKDWKF